MLNTNEFKKAISKIEQKDWFEGYTFLVTNGSIDLNKEIIGLNSIYRFFYLELSKWNRYDKEMPDVIHLSMRFSQTVIEFLNNFIKKTTPSNQNLFRQEFQTYLQRSLGTRNQIQYFPAENPHTKFLLRMFNINNNYYVGARDFLASPDQGRERRIGEILAYEYYLKDKSKLANRRDEELESIEGIKNDFALHVEKSEGEILDLIENISKNGSQRLAMLAKKNNKIRDDSLEALADINSSKVTIREKFDKFYEQEELAAKSLKEETYVKILALEEIYENKLRLQKPADYWNKKAKELSNQYKSTIRILFGLGTIFLATLYFLLWQTPEGMLESFETNKLAAIRWSILYVTFISIFAYLMRILVKSAFSSYHLARDAEEREQLTYVYLALSKDGQIEENDRHLILQSIFSRAETGLLKDDSSPTMPMDVSKILNK